MTALPEVPPISAVCPYPLGEFVEPSAASLEVFALDEAAMPQPYRRLLVHESDMTSTLEAHHGEPIVLRQLAHRHEGGSLLRQVLLLGSDSGRIFEYGAIHIHLNRFAPAARQEILEGQTPLGTVLAQYNVSYDSRPQLFFELTSDRQIDGWLELRKSAQLFGRQNVLLGSSGPLAEVVEILPPASVDEALPTPRTHPSRV